MTPARAYAWFLVASGGRVALRALAVGGMAAVALVVFDPEPLALLARLARGVAGTKRDPAVAVLLGVVAAAATHQTAQRLLVGSRGWVGHLPVSERARRRATWLAAIVTEAPIALALGGGAAFAFALEERVSLWKLASWPPLLAGAALLALPVRRRALTGALCIGAIAGALSAVPLAVAGAVPLVWLADRVAGPLAAPPRTQSHRSRAPRFFDARVAVRAVGWRALGGVPSAVVCGAALYFFLRNNTLSASTAGRAARGVGPLVVGLCIGPCADAVLARRPSWPWARSLPRSSRSRVARDALLLAVPAAFLCVALAFVHPAAAWSALCATPLLACAGAGAMRVGAGKRLATTGEVFLVAVAATALSAAHVVGSLACLVAVLPALTWAAARESRLKPSRWIELHHGATGDTLSWSGG